MACLHDQNYELQIVFVQVNGTEADYEYEDITLERVRSF